MFFTLVDSDLQPVIEVLQMRSESIRDIRRKLVSYLQYALPHALEANPAIAPVFLHSFICIFSELFLHSQPQFCYSLLVGFRPINRRF